MKRTLWLIFTVIFLISGCGTATKGQQNPPGPPVQQTKSQGPSISLGTAREAKATAQQDKRVDAATAVAIEKDLSVALKVSNFNRLYLKDIRQNVHQSLRDQFPAYTVYVTTDSKLFSELEKLQKEMRKNRPSQPSQVKTYEKKLQKINDDMKG